MQSTHGKTTAYSAPWVCPICELLVSSKLCSLTMHEGFRPISCISNLIKGSHGDCFGCPFFIFAIGLPKALAQIITSRDEQLRSVNDFLHVLVAMSRQQKVIRRSVREYRVR